MRDILFRGKREDNGEWLYGYPLIDMAECSLKAKGKCVCPHDGSSAEILFWNDAFHEYNSESVIPDTIGQYTGLTDKNGVKIFEGDVVHVHDTTLQCTKPYHEFDGYVKFSLGMFRILDKKGIGKFCWSDYDVLVIGNIHDNPELLDGEDKV